MSKEISPAVMTSGEIEKDILHFTSDAHCWFDQSGKFLSCSQSTFDYFPQLEPVLLPQAPYAAVLQAIKAANLFINMPKEATQENWEQDQLSLLLGFEPLSFKNQLQDGRLLHIKRMAFSDGRCLLLFDEITSEYQERRARTLSDEKFEQFAKLSSNWFWYLDADLRYVSHSSHRQPLAGVDAGSLVGKSRIIRLNGMVKDDEQLHEHNACLLTRQNVDVVLTWQRANGQTIYSHVLAQPQFDNNGVFRGYLGCGRDVSSFYELKQQYKYQANHDYLTRLLNRRAFERLLQEAIDCHGESDNLVTSSSILTIDLDRFKLVNDEGGHSAGDQLLVEVAGLLNEAFASPAVIARLGGDEFGVYLPVGQSAAVELARSFIQKVGDYVFNWNGRSFTIGASVGIAEIAGQVADQSVLLREADSACYAAKRLGRNRVQVYSAQDSFLAHQSIEAGTLRRLKSAVDNDRLALYLQPIVPADDPANCMKYEVLLRILDEAGAVIGPGEFIPVAEKYDLMQDIDQIIVKRSLQYLREFHDYGVAAAFCINLSGNSLSDASVLQNIVDLVTENKDLAGSICFELTETAAINSLKTVVQYIDLLSDLGCEFALDDFGTGLSSYNYLKALKVDYLKIDGSFVRSMLVEPTSMAIVKSINTLSHEMNMRTVAEHVSELELADALAGIKVDYLQGFYYGKPVAVEEILSLYTAQFRQTGTNS